MLQKSLFMELGCNSVFLLLGNDLIVLAITVLFSGFRKFLFFSFLLVPSVYTV